MLDAHSLAGHFGGRLIGAAAVVLAVGLTLGAAAGYLLADRDPPEPKSVREYYQQCQGCGEWLYTHAPPSETVESCPLCPITPEEFEELQRQLRDRRDPNPEELPPDEARRRRLNTEARDRGDLDSLQPYTGGDPLRNPFACPYCENEDPFTPCSACNGSGLVWNNPGFWEFNFQSKQWEAKR